MDAAHWPQEIGFLKPPVPFSSSSSSIISSSSSSFSMAEVIMLPPPPLPSSSMASSTSTRTPAQPMEKRARPSKKEQALHCPRCSSTNTKFCYYNNYSLAQPRYFCKTCRRYWTEGGSLRNVPVGGGSRKNKKPTSATGTAAPPPPPPPPPPPSAGLPAHDLNPNFQEAKHYSLPFYSNEAMTTNPFAPLQEASADSVMYPSGLGLPSFLSSAVNHTMNMQEGGVGRLIPPLQDLAQIPPAFEQDRGQGTNTSSGFWNGAMGGGGPSW